VGTGGITPNPRNDSADSAMITEPKPSVADTMIGASEFAIRWRKIIIVGLAPSEWLAITNSCSRRLNTEARTRRALVIQPKIASTKMMIRTLKFEPRKFCNAENWRRLLDRISNSGKSGSVSIRSVKRISKVSTHLPAKPDTAPTAVPKMIFSAVMISATDSEMRPAYRMRGSVSRPRPSVPIQCMGLLGWPGVNHGEYRL